MKRAHEAGAKRGDPMRGGTRPFGHTADWSVIVPAEAKLIREAKRRLLAGESLRGICFDWAERGVVSSAGHAWKQRSLRRSLMSARLSGQREFQGKLMPGKWPAILKPADTAKLRSLLTAPDRQTYRPSSARRYLLSGGLVRCGRCGSHLVARPRADRVRRYVCARQPGSANCGRLARLADPLEDVVKQAVIVALDGADLTAYLDDQDDDAETGLLASIRADEERLEQLSRDHYVDEAISRVEYFAARTPIEARLAQSRADLTRDSTRTLLHRVAGAGAEIAKQWPDQTFDWRRAILAAVLDHVVLLPAVRGRNAFDVDCVQLVWRF